ncbi:CHAT domain-containing protein [Suillus clintonianus]|uniref:CHAT domain-containing protein n=1 Tax=Suillus clintonianus TaxID=1904413 RepID=UPI001B883886|nr:CHAT domain-containing protein [Suillus clintonianus]KAG2150943.1 CHAT domain-containing protein [Suillus clintonianus]
MLTSSHLQSEISRVTEAAHEAYALYSKTNHRNDLDRTIQGFQAVLERCPNGHPDRAAALSNLAHVIFFGTTKNVRTDIDHAISLFRSALALRPRGHPDHPLSIFNLCKALHQRHLNGDDFASVREAVELYRSLLPLCLCPPGHPCRVWSLSNLPADLCDRFHKNGDIDDIDRAVQFSRDALAIRPDDAGHDFFLGVLSYALQLRFDHHGDPRDLDESIPLYRATLDLRPPFDPARWTSLNNLAEALIARYNQCGNVSDFEEAMRLHQEALDLRPRGHARCDYTLNNLAVALYAHFGKSGDINALDDAIGFYREALEMRPPGDKLHCHASVNLASALQKRFTRTLVSEDIEEATGHCQEALESLPIRHPERYFSYVSLQGIYLARYNVHCDIDDLANAFKNYRLAVNHRTQGFPRRIVNAFQWIVDAEKYNHDSALEAYQTLLHLLDIHLSTRSSVISRREAVSQLRLAPALSGNAASFAIRRGELVTAVELLERGRALLWSQVSRLRTPTDQLHIARPLLAARFVALSEQLSPVTHGHGSDAADGAAATCAKQQFETLSKQWEAVVAQIRGVDGFSRFLLPPSYDDVRLAAQDGPIILLVASEYSCHSLIITRDAEQPHHVPLPSLNLANLEELKDDFLSTMRSAVRTHQKEPRTKLLALLRKVWDKVMLPIVMVLRGDLKVEHRSRIWLCPTAAFTSIPLHAASLFRVKADGSGPELCLEDIYICSYTPTISALIRARQTMKMHVSPSFVAIGQGQPGAGQGEVLMNVDSELDLVCGLIPSKVGATILRGDEATKLGALEALRHNTWVHIACNSDQEYEQPYNSRFAMRDKPVTLLDIMENNAPKAEFAFLSSCHTAIGDEQTPDEVIHLAAGLLFSGFKSVIGTLSVVDDDVAKEIVQAFYENMFTDGVMDCRKAASALNNAIRAVKVQQQVPLEQSIIFIHIGV